MFDWPDNAGLQCGVEPYRARGRNDGILSSVEVINTIDNKNCILHAYYLQIQ